MKYRPECISYPVNEEPKLVLLENLFREWHEFFAKSELGEQKVNDIVFDGFYPHYFSQKKRILFIGRESRDITGENYVDLLCHAYRKGKKIGSQHLNLNKFHSRMIHIAWGIMCGLPDWQEIPWANKIGDTFGMANGLSFAFMNISKLSNGNKKWQSDWSLINEVHKISNQNRNFNQEELAILNPHIVITMNLGEKIGSLGKLTSIKNSKQADSYWLENGAIRCLLIDTWHFAAPGKKCERDFYIPICDAIRNGGMG